MGPSGGSNGQWIVRGAVERLRGQMSVESATQ